MKEKEQAQAREDELQEVIQRLKDQLAERERGDGAGDERMERRNSRPCKTFNATFPCAS